MLKITSKKYLQISFLQLLANGMHLGHYYKSANALLDKFFIGRRFSVIILNLLTSVINLRRSSLVLYGTVKSHGFILFVIPA